MSMCIPAVYVTVKNVSVHVMNVRIFTYDERLCTRSEYLCTCSEFFCTCGECMWTDECLYTYDECLRTFGERLCILGDISDEDMTTCGVVYVPMVNSMYLWWMSMYMRWISIYLWWMSTCIPVVNVHLSAGAFHLMFPDIQVLNTAVRNYYTKRRVRTDFSEHNQTECTGTHGIWHCRDREREHWGPVLQINRPLVIENTGHNDKKQHWTPSWWIKLNPVIADHTEPLSDFF
jgi:hypothetical protein